MLVSVLWGQFLPAKRCNSRPARLQQYPGILCEFDTATFRVPQDELDTLRQLLQAALHARCLSSRTHQRLAGKCMSMTVAIRPVSLFAVLADLEKAGLCIVDLTRDSRADILGEFKPGRNLSAPSPEVPWQRARQFAEVLVKWSSNASSVAWGGVVNTTSGTFPAGGQGVPPDSLSNHVNQKEMYGLYHLLRQFCDNPGVPRREKCSWTWTSRQ